MEIKDLKAITRLFAIFSRFLFNGSYDERYENQVIKYLIRILGLDNYQEYLVLFNYYSKNYHAITKNEKKLKSLLGLKAIIITEKLNYSLVYVDKLMIVATLLEMAEIFDDKDYQVQEFITSIRQQFGIPCSTFNILQHFTALQFYHEMLRDKVLLLTGNAEENEKFNYSIFYPGMKDNVFALYLDDEKILIVKVLGVQDNILVNNLKVESEGFLLLEPSSAIRSPYIDSLYHAEIIRVFLLFTSIPVKITCKEVYFQYPNGTHGVQDITFGAGNGELIGIMGSSGVGKSTLIKLLAGEIDPDQGTVEINGVNLHVEKDLIKGVIGYIPQDDFIIEELTVYQNLWYAARFCYDDLNAGERAKSINNIMEQLDLSEIKHSRIGKPKENLISGGQRKRLNIAMDLLREPSILLVDEPTTGLSSSDSERVMELLKMQSLKGKIVIVNIHQPASDIFKLFDKILVIDRGGVPTYFGNPVHAISYFRKASNRVVKHESDCPCCGNLNAEDILKLLERKKRDSRGKLTNERVTSPGKWHKRYKSLAKHPVGGQHFEQIPRGNLTPPSILTQLGLYFRRNVQKRFADKQYLWVTLLESPLLAFILAFMARYSGNQQINGYSFGGNDNYPAFLFMSVLVALFLGMIVSADEIYKDRFINKREKFLDLSKFAYLASKALYLIMVSFFQILVFVIVSFWMLEVRDMLWSTFLMLLSTAFFANLVGLNLSASIRSMAGIYIVIPLVLIPQILLSGTIISFDKLNPVLANKKYTPFVGDLMASRWAYEGLMVHNFMNNDYGSVFYWIDKKESELFYKANYLIPALQEITDKDLPEIKPDWKLVLNNLAKLNEEPVVPSREKEFLEMELNEPNIHWVREKLKDKRAFYNSLIKQVINLKDQKIAEESREQGGNPALLVFKEKNYNSRLGEILKDRDKRNKIIQHKNDFIKKYEPIYTFPDSRIGRGHFYSPVKILGNFFIQTYWFNIFVIWTMNLILFILLYYDVLNKILNRRKARSKGLD